MFSDDVGGAIGSLDLHGGAGAGYGHEGRPRTRSRSDSMTFDGLSLDIFGGVSSAHE